MFSSSFFSVCVSVCVNEHIFLMSKGKSDLILGKM